MGNKEFMRQAVALAVENARLGGGPFGALVVKDGCVIGEGNVLDQGIRINPRVVLSPQSISYS